MSAPHLRATTLGYVAVLGASATWGTASIFTKMILRASDVSVIALAFWAELLTGATLFLVLVIGQRAKLRVRPRDVPRLFALGVALSAFDVLWVWAVWLNGASIATIQQSTMPAIVVIAAWWLWREPLTARKIGAVALTFAGTVLVSGADALGQSNLTFNGLLVGACLPMAYAAWNLIGKSVRAQYDGVTILAYGFVFAALTLLPFQFSAPFPLPAPSSSLLWFAGLVAQSIIAFSLYTFGLGRLPAGIASILSMSEIVFVSIYAYTFLSERLGWMQVIGTVVVIGGLVLLIENDATTRASGRLNLDSVTTEIISHHSQGEG